MKKLQNNFTTPEQAQRLLELGVPADSADCYFYDWDLDDVNIHSRGGSPQIFDWFEIDIKKFEGRKCIKMYPCWSVGRLIEIFLLCTPYKDIALNKSNIIEQMVVSLFMVNRDGLLDFSKLEE